MHELSVCLSMLERVRGIARQHHAQQVVKIHVQLGPLSGIEPQLLEQAFSIASAGTVAEAAKLILELSDLQVRCLDCQQESPVEANNLLCPACGSPQTQLISGDEMVLARVELLTEPDPVSEKPTFH